MLLALALLVSAQTAPPLSLQSVSQTLDNGLVVVVSPDRSVPGVAVEVMYRVGSRDEEPGRTGFAHLFEHLMFMGARHLPYPKFDAIIEAAGGESNASTSDDITNYVESGPSNLLETFLWMEADRMASLGRMMTGEKLETQRKVVLNERRQSFENRPYGMAEYLLPENLFPKGHPYSWPTIGAPGDLENAQLAEVTAFFARFYLPDNATLVVVGDVEPEKVFALARKYFAFIPRRELPAVKAPAPLVLAGEKRVSLTDKVELPKLILAWPSPPAYAPGDAECDLLAAILAQGKASRLYQRLIHREQLASEVQAFQQSQDLQGTFRIGALAAPGHGTDELRAAIDDELKKMIAEGPTEAEVETARARVIAAVASSLEGLQPRARRLADYAVHFHDANSLQRDLARYTSATPDSIRKAAQQVLGPGRLSIEVQPDAVGAAGGAQ